MRVSHKLGNLFSVQVIGRLPIPIQKKISQLMFYVSSHKASKYFIPVYCHKAYKDKNHINKFIPPNNNSTYSCFQDFFIRRYKSYPNHTRDAWPCDGLLCEYGKIKDLKETQVKGNKTKICKIFGKKTTSIPPEYFYSNIFLHNRDYHYIHSPTNGIVSRIEHIPSELIMLRPWFYPHDPSYPAFRNERVNIDITADTGDIWYLSIVGGLGVGTITLNEQCVKGGKVVIGKGLAKFLLGSTCCMAAPIKTNKKIGDNVSIHEEYNL